ncbi:MAG: glycosyltransferase family 4 protein [Candidatus Dormibacteraeota bacterium]|nr:glycosyltransferase family 4 protein [Candidatus Dormibacteraeota bacterium]
MYVCHSKEIGGAELYLAGLARRALADGWPVTLVCRRDPVLDVWAGRLLAGGIAVRRNNLAAPADYLEVVPLLRRAGLVHVVLAYPVGKYQLVAAVLARLLCGRLVITHQLALDISTVRLGRWRQAFWTVLFRGYGRLARLHIASSRAGADLLTGRYGFPRSAVTVIYNGANLQLFTPLRGPARLEVRQGMAAALGVTEAWQDALLACTVARLNPQKGLVDLVEAAARVIPAVPQARFVIIGAGDLRPELEGRIAALGLGGRVLLAGAKPLDEIARWLGAADLFVLPSHNEGLPLSLVEAMGAGCPAVATAVGGVGEVLADERAGLLVPPRAVDQLAAAIMRLLMDPERRRSMSAAARERVVTTFDVDRCYGATVARYQDLARAGRDSRPPRR